MSPDAAPTLATDATERPVAPDPFHPAARDRLRWLALLVAIVLAGAAVRVQQYASRPAYWHDEASLALNVFERPARALATGPLDAIPEAPQAAPPLFLLAQRAMYRGFGRSELGMRLVPLAAGLASLGLFARLAWRALPPPAAALAVLMFALSDRLIGHANEAKQYAGDVLLCVVLLMLARPRDDGGTDRAAAARLALVSVAAAVGLWFSHPVAFVFGGISLALLPAVVRERRRGGRVVWATCNVMVVASFLALYVFSIRAQQAGPLFTYWVDEFVPWSRLWELPMWLVRTSVAVCNYPLELAGPVLLALAVLGARALAKARRREWLAMLVGPAALVLLAAAAHRYPFGGRRLTLFLAPMVFLLAAGGAVELRRLAAPHVGRWWLVVPAFLVGVAGWRSAAILIEGSGRGDIRPAVRYVLDHRQPDDAIYTTKTSELFCYWPAGRDPDVHFAGDRFEPAERRFWLVASHVPGRAERAIGSLLESLDVVADRRDEFVYGAGAAVLFETRAPHATGGVTTRPGAAPAVTDPNGSPPPE